MDFHFKHVENGSVVTVTLSPERIRELLSAELYETLYKEHSCRCEPVGDVSDCGCEKRLDGFELQEL